jgi:predicted nucleotidyltransferase
MIEAMKDLSCKTLSREELIHQLAALESALRAEGVTGLALFGSRARQDNSPDSDIDLVIDIEANRRFSLLDLIGVQHIIGDRIGIEANILPKRSLEPGFLRELQRDGIVIYQ